MGGCTICKFKGGGGAWQERGGGVFERGGGWYPNAHYGISSGITFYGLSLRFQALHEIRDKEKFIRNWLFWIDLLALSSSFPGLSSTL